MGILIRDPLTGELTIPPEHEAKVEAALMRVAADIARSLQDKKASLEREFAEVEEQLVRAQTYIPRLKDLP